MSKRRIFDLVLLVVVIGLAFGVYYRYPRIVRTEAVQVLSYVAPCNRPITYRIGSIDSRFKLTPGDLQMAVSSAVQVWNIEGGKKFFQLDQENGIITISLAYDDRQKNTQTLDAMAEHAQNERSSFEPLQLQYDALHSTYLTKKRELDLMTAEYRTALAAFNARAEVQKIRGAGKPSNAEELQAERTQLDYDLRLIQERQNSLNADIEKINKIAKELNRLINAYNIRVAQYNVIGSALSGQFEEGVFLSKPGSEEIVIYQYEDMPHLRRVLAHELGHALGLNHIEDEEAIMYKVNQGTELHLSVSDYEELTKACIGIFGKKGL